MNTTEKLLKELNAARGLKYPDIGYSYFADIKGDGRNIRSIYIIINENGGVCYSSLNGKTPRERCNKIRRAIRLEPIKKMTASDIKHYYREDGHFFRPPNYEIFRRYNGEFRRIH